MTARLFVGNLPYDANEKDLREHLSAVGPLSYVYFPVDRESGKPRGFAFVEFNEQAHAQEAIRRFNNQMFKGRQLAVNEARAREERPGSRPPVSSAHMAPEPGGASRRNFGPDASPRRSRKPSRGGAKAERGPKRPIRERTGGPLVFGGEDEDFHDDELSGDNFASRLTESPNCDDE